MVLGVRHCTGEIIGHVVLEHLSWAAFAGAIDEMATARPATKIATFMTIFLSNSGTGDAIPERMRGITILCCVRASIRQFVSDCRCCTIRPAIEDDAEEISAVILREQQTRRTNTDEIIERVERSFSEFTHVSNRVLCLKVRSENTAANCKGAYAPFSSRC